MKRILYSMFIFVGILSLLSACNQEEVIDYPNTSPVVIIVNETITAAPGQEITISGTLKDEFGLKSVVVENSLIGLNKSFAVSSRTEILDSFELIVTHKLPANITAQEVFIKVTCKNLTGQITEVFVKVVLS